MLEKEIQDTFKQMIINHEQINVKAICEKVNISRKTFYKYYRDIENLLDSIINNDLYNTIDQIYMIDNLKKDDSITLLNFVFNSLYENRVFYTTIYYSKYKEAFLQSLYLQNKKINKNLFSKYNNNPIELDYEVYIVACAGVGLIAKWIEDDYQISSREVSNIFKKYIIDGMSNLTVHY